MTNLYRITNPHNFELTVRAGGKEYLVGPKHSATCTIRDVPMTGTEVANAMQVQLLVQRILIPMQKPLVDSPKQAKPLLMEEPNAKQTQEPQKASVLEVPATAVQPAPRTEIVEQPVVETAVVSDQPAAVKAPAPIEQPVMRGGRKARR